MFSWNVSTLKTASAHPSFGRWSRGYRGVRSLRPWPFRGFYFYFFSKHYYNNHTQPRTQHETPSGIIKNLKTHWHLITESALFVCNNVTTRVFNRPKSSSAQCPHAFCWLLIVEIHDTFAFMTETNTGQKFKLV